MSQMPEFSRRQLFRQAGILGLSLSALPAVLEGCATSVPVPTPLPAPLKLHWRLASSWGIQLDDAATLFVAGHVNDVLELPDGSIIVGTDTGGVWVIAANNASVTPLSNMWDNPDVRCLAQGPRVLDHLFAACSRYVPNKISTLYERDPSNALTDPWREIALPGIGNIRNMAISQATNRIALACDNGIFWSDIPTAPNGPYSFKRAIGQNIDANVLVGPFYDIKIESGDLAVGAVAETIIATSQPTSTPADMLYGAWQGSDLVLFEANLGAGVLERLSIESTSVAISPQNPNIAYAVSSNLADKDDDRTIAVFWASQDGGRTWYGSVPRLAQKNHPLSSVSGGQGGNWNNCIAVSPLDAKLVAIGWVHSFYSTDAGATWHQYTGQQDHDDHHRILFNTAGNVFLAADGGVFVGKADFTGFSSSLNRHLPNLQFYAPYGLREAWGTESVSPATSGLTGGGLQDNGNAFALMTVNGAAGPWRQFDGGDGGLWLFIGTGQAIATQVLDGSPAYYGHWDPGKQFVVPDGVIPNGSDPSGIITPIVDVILHTLTTNSKGQKMWAVGVTTVKPTTTQISYLYGLFADDDGSGLHWEQLQALEYPQNANYAVTAVASYSGQRVIMGFVGPAVSVYDRQTTAIQTATGLPSYDNRAAIGRIIALSEQEAIATDNTFPFSSQLYATADGGLTWHSIAQTGLPNEVIYAMCADYETNPPTLYATADANVYQSVDHGVTWVSVSAGLPTRPHCADIHITQLSTGPRIILLGTYGRSMYLANLNGSD